MSVGGTGGLARGVEHVVCMIPVSLVPLRGSTWIARFPCRGVTKRALHPAARRGQAGSPLV